MAEEGTIAVVIDNGSGLCKIGFSGEDGPRSVIPTVVGRVKENKDNVKDTYIGDELSQHLLAGISSNNNNNSNNHSLDDIIAARETLLSIKNPVTNGVITDWDDLEALYHYAFADLGVNPEDQPVHLSESPLNPKANREKLTEIMFELFKVPAMYVSMDSVLSLYTSGRTTGIVVDCGHGITSVVPVYEGFAFPHAITKLDLAGNGLTSYLSDLLQGGKKKPTTPANKRTTSMTTAPPPPSGFLNSFCGRNCITDIKEKLCYVAYDYDKEVEKAFLLSKSEDSKLFYELPDGNTIAIGPEERFKCPEALFQPSLVGLTDSYNVGGIHTAVYRCIKKCDGKYTRPGAGRNIILCGGTASLPGIGDRLQKELDKLMPPTWNIQVILPPERKHSTWIGGSLLASLPTFQSMWCTEKEFDESGASIINRKCF